MRLKISHTNFTTGEGGETETDMAIDFKKRCFKFMTITKQGIYILVIPSTFHIGLIHSLVCHVTCEPDEKGGYFKYFSPNIVDNLCLISNNFER